MKRPQPDEEGRWAFYTTFPLQGAPDFMICAKTSKEARKILEDYVYNELDGRYPVTADD